MRLTHRKHLDVAVVVDRDLAVCFQVKGVDHVEIAYVRRRRLVRDVDRMLQGDIPDGKRLELRVPRLHAALVVVVQLRQAGRELAAAGAGAGDDYERMLRLDVLVRAVALVADDDVDVGRIAARRAMRVHLDAAALQPDLERLRRGLVVEPRDDYRRNLDAPIAQVVDELERVDVIGDAEVPAHLPALDVPRVDAQEDVGLVLDALQEPHLDVRVEPGQHARRMQVVKKFAAELEIQLLPEPRGPLPNRRRLLFEVLLVVKPRSDGHPLSPEISYAPPVLQE